MKILLVEDDERMAATLASALMADRHTVNIATDGHMGLMLAQTYDYDLVVLDDLVPRLDGVSVCRRLRSQGLQMPILLLTAKDSQTDKIVGLDAGADDYVVKPFDLEELRARVRALLRRRSAPIATVLTWERLCLDPAANTVTYNRVPIALTPKEFGILELFLRHPQRVFSRSAIIDRLWSLEESPAESAVTTHIKDLRQKLKAGGMAIDLIETVYGLGYRLKTPPAASTSGASSTSSAPSASSAPSGSMHRPALVQRVIDKFKDSFVAQVAVLQQADVALRAGELSQTLQETARQEAHKLAGSLGIFGHPDGSELAREAEHLLAQTDRPHTISASFFSQLVSALQQEIAQLALPHAAETAAVMPTIEALADPDPSSALDANSPPVCQNSAPSSRSVLLISRDNTLAESLQAAAASWNLHIHAMTQLEEVWTTIVHAQPDGLLLDLSISDLPNESLLFLAEFTHHYPDLPVLVLSERDSLGDRVSVSRLGSKAFLPKPASAEQILQAIGQALPQAHTGEFKVLIVDDDPAVLVALKTLLQPWGLQVTTLKDPKRFWEMLVATQPDLVVVDLEMPTFSGIDLCQVVRHDPRWGDLPILVVTAHTSAESIRQVFAAGADDFIAKPVVGPELVTRIISRLERVRSRRQPPETDADHEETP
jgi:DNA-binding response OmpR family regulator